MLGSVRGHLAASLERLPGCPVYMSASHRARCRRLSCDLPRACSPLPLRRPPFGAATISTCCRVPSPPSLSLPPNVGVETAQAFAVRGPRQLPCRQTTTLPSIRRLRTTAGRDKRKPRNRPPHPWQSLAVPWQPRGPVWTPFAVAAQPWSVGAVRTQGGVQPGVAAFRGAPWH